MSDEDEPWWAGFQTYEEIVAEHIQSAIELARIHDIDVRAVLAKMLNENLGEDGLPVGQAVAVIAPLLRLEASDLRAFLLVGATEEGMTVLSSLTVPATQVQLAMDFIKSTQQRLAEGN